MHFIYTFVQVVASLAKNLLMLDLGLATSYSTIAIPALTGRDPLKNAEEFLHITEDQVSWLGMCRDRALTIIQYLYSIYCNIVM